MVMCYKDRTFCPFSKCEKFGTCDRALTEEVGKEAQRLGLFISSWASEPDCYEEKEEEES